MPPSSAWRGSAWVPGTAPAVRPWSPDFLLHWARVLQLAPPRADSMKMRPQAGGFFDKSGAGRTRRHSKHGGRKREGHGRRPPVEFGIFTPQGSTVQAQGVAGHRGGCDAVVFHCWASGSQPTDGQALLNGGAFLGTLRSSSARETCRAKPTGALAFPSGAVAPEGLLSLKQGTIQLALPND